MKVATSKNSGISESLPPHSSKNWVVSHWTKSTPEEGIQVIFNTSEVNGDRAKKVKLETHSPSTERPCQWEFTLGLAEPSIPRSSADLSMAKPKKDAFQLTIQPSPTMLVFTLDRIFHRDMGTGTGLYMEDPEGAGRVRCDAYRTMYIYSPKLRRDICVHTIEPESWPQCVVFDGSEIVENHGQEYHFQIWLVGSIPRHVEAKTDIRIDQYQKLLWALRKDLSTTNVVITIKDFEVTRREDQKDLHIMDPSEIQTSLQPNENPFSTENYPTYETPRMQGPVFKAHKCILEATGFFSRMLNGQYRESQMDDNGMYRIELSSDMFDEDIIDILLDYLYTRIPITSTFNLGSLEDNSSKCHPKEIQTPKIHSPNVGLNLRATGTSTISSISSLHTYGDCDHHQKPFLRTGLTLRHWGALYRASIHLEDVELQRLSLQQIQTHLNPETTLDEILNWGHQFEEVKSIMLEYLVKKRKDVFGDEKGSKLRPYLWTEFDGQLETLVEITSQIARH